MDILKIAIGFVLLLGGAELLVRGSVTLARRLGVSALVIGMTVVAFGTSAPEFVVTLRAGLAGVSGIAVGNVVGSNIANILLILGVAGILMPVVCPPGMARRDGPILGGVTVVFMVLCAVGPLDVWHGAVLLTLFGGFLGFSYWRERGGADPDDAHAHAQEAEEVAEVPGGLWLALLVTILGLGGVIWGADLLVDGGANLARSLGVSEEVIGLTLIAVGTSLPELAATVVAAIRGHADVALGNVIGSNLFNMLFVVGGTVVIAPLAVPAQILAFDQWVMLAATVALMAILFSGRRLGRGVSALMLATYAAYIGAQAYGVERLL